ncbi:MAG TPA: lysylphosphatidylglycerol synthase transmembrane domain-containing protein [Myxococcales bacterium]|nr:lysylphosphatidylglycerol synthase transmembrane domain-containing protein [Myxococcales bacterium]
MGIRSGDLAEPDVVRPWWRRVRPVARWAASAAVLGACGYYLATRTDRTALVRALAQANYWLVLAMAAGHLVVLLPLKAWRWALMLAPIQRLPLWRLYGYVLAGSAVSNLIPARAGHAARVLLLRRDGVPLAAGAGTILLEEIYNVLVLAVLALPLPWVLPLPARVSGVLRLVAAGAALGIAAAFWLAALGRARPTGIVGRLARGLLLLSSTRSAAIVLLQSFAMWLLDIGQILLAMAAVGMAPGFFGATLVLLFINLVNAVPATPGQVGLFEAGAAAACVIAGATPEQGIAVGVLYHMMQLIPETVLGALVLARNALGSRELRAMATSLPPPAMPGV